MPVDWSLYPPKEEWRALRRAVLERAGLRCEGSPAYPDCRARQGQPHPVTGARVVLTTAHLYDDDLATRDITRLRAWCQRCHNTYDAALRRANAARTRQRKALLRAATPWCGDAVGGGAVRGADAVSDARREGAC